MTVKVTHAAVALIAAVLMAWPAVPVSAQLPGQVDAVERQTAERVYEALARQFRDGRPAPEFRMGTRALQVASFSVQEAAIELEVPAYRVARSLGADSLNGLAYLLGHELAHYYMDHARRAGVERWFAGLGAAPAPPAPERAVADALAQQERNLRMAQRRELEMEADLKAGFYAYLAGYRPLAVAPDFLRAVYAAYPASAAGNESHPPLDDRIVITERVDSALTQLIDVFDGAVHLLVVGRYAEASRVFDHVARSFPSREVLSNAGVARALWALELMGDSARFAYPFELDAESRLGRKGDRGDMGFGPADHRRAMRLAREARELFEQASARDPEYATSQVNLAAIYDVLGEHEVALALAGVAARTAEAHGEQATLAHARIVQAIAQSRLGQRDAALALLQTARTGSAALAALNESAVRTGQRPVAEAAGGELPAAGRERIAALTTDDMDGMGQPDLQFNLPAVDRDRPAIGIYSRRLDGVPAMLVGDARELVFILRTPADYTGESARGIRLGSSEAEVRESYGVPARVVAARQGAWHVYHMNQIAFHVDASGRVAGWLIFTY